MYGCHDLMHGLLEADLVDEVRILLHPVLFGRGRSFLADGAEPVRLALVDSAVLASGVAVLTYRPARGGAPPAYAGAAASNASSAA